MCEDTENRCDVPKPTPSEQNLPCPVPVKLWLEDVAKNQLEKFKKVWPVKYGPIVGSWVMTPKLKGSIEVCPGNETAIGIALRGAAINGPKYERQYTPESNDGVKLKSTIESGKKKFEISQGIEYKPQGISLPGGVKCSMLGGIKFAFLSIDISKMESKVLVPEVALGGKCEGKGSLGGVPLKVDGTFQIAVSFEVAWTETIANLVSESLKNTANDMVKRVISSATGVLGDGLAVSADAVASAGAAVVLPSLFAAGATREFASRLPKDSRSRSSATAATKEECKGLRDNLGLSGGKKLAEVDDPALKLKAERTIEEIVRVRGEQFDKANEGEYDWEERRGPTWGFRGIFRGALRNGLGWCVYQAQW